MKNNLDRLVLGRPSREHRHAWLWEKLESDPGFQVRPMFGGRALYFDGRLYLYFAAKEEPWCGLCVCTARENHEELLREFPALAPHVVLSKWLYLSENSEHFESCARKLLALARARDSRLGVESKPKRRKKRDTFERPR